MAKLGSIMIFLNVFDLLPSKRHVNNVKKDGARNIPHLVIWKRGARMSKLLIEVRKYNSNDQKPKQQIVNPKAFAAGLFFFEIANIPTTISMIAVIRY